MKQGTTKRLPTRRQEQSAEPTALNKAREPGETWPDGEDMPPLDRKAVMDDLVALQGIRDTLRRRARRPPHGRARQSPSTPKAAPRTARRRSMRSCAISIPWRSARSRAPARSSGATRRSATRWHRKAAPSRNGRWAIWPDATTARSSASSHWVMQARLQLCREERKRDSRKALYRSRAAMWDAEKRARAIEQAMLIYRHSEKGTPEYRQARREQAEREIEAYANSITEKQRYRSELSL